MTLIKRPSHSWTVIAALCLLLLGSTLSLQAQYVMPTATVILVSDATDPAPMPTSISEEVTATPIDTPVEPTATWTPTDTPVEPTAMWTPTDTPVEPTATWTITPTLTLVATDPPIPTDTPMPTATFTPVTPATQPATSTPSAEVTATAIVIISETATPTVTATETATEAVIETATQIATEMATETAEMATESATETPVPTSAPSPTSATQVPQQLAAPDVMGAVQEQEESSSLVVTAQDVAFSVAQLTGSTTTVDGTTTDWVADDTTGLGDGWHLTVTATDFVNGSHTIPKEGFAMRLLDADISVISGNAKPTAVAAFANFTGIGTTRTFAAAGANDGMGSYSLLPTFQLSVPAQSYAGTYLSTVTVTIIAGPGS